MTATFHSLRHLRHLRPLPGLCAIALLAACGGSDDRDDWADPNPPSILNVQKIDGRYYQGKKAPEALFKVLETEPVAPATTLTLPALDATEVLHKRWAEPEPAAPGVLHIAEAQGVAEATDAASFARLLQWQAQADGSRVAALRIHATDAFGVRLGLLVDALPAQAQVRVHQGELGGLSHSTSGADILATLARNQAAGDHSEAARTWWSPDLGGDSVTLELTLPAGIGAEQLQVALPSISHTFVSPLELQALEPTNNLPPTLEKNSALASSACDLDVTCYTTGTAQRDAVARMRYVERGRGYACTGTLLNDAIASNLPYFLTANHCITNQTVASTLETDWFYRSNACNSSQLDARSTTRSGGAQLLFTSNVTQGNDVSLLLLNDAPPSGAFMAGWDANLNDASQAVYSIHHPNDQLAKISGGEVINYGNCDGISCAGNRLGRFYQVQWSEGTTALGSSGGALFSSSGHVLGTLYGGNASCTDSEASDFYGRLDMAFANGINAFLAASRPPF